MQSNDTLSDSDNKGCSTISVQNLQFTTGIGRSKVKILNGINIIVDKGTIYGLLGPSGCGKTTLLKCLITSLKPNKGNISVFGLTLGLSETKIPGSGVGYMPQELALYSELTIGESLAFYGRLHLMKRKDIEFRTTFLLDFLKLSNKNKLIRNLSGGEQRRVSFAIALLHQPPLLILDEPTVGVDPVLRRSIWNYLAKLSSDENVTIIVTTHYIDEAMQANKVGLMRYGRILAEGAPYNLINKYDVSDLEDVFLNLSEEQSSTVNKRLKNYNTTELDSKKESIAHTKIGRKLSDCIKLPSLRRICAITIKDFMKMWRNVFLIVFQFISPGFQIAGFLAMFNSDVHDINLAVLNQDNNLSLSYLHHINNYTIHQMPIKNLQQGADLVSQGNAWGILHIWPNFSSAFIDKFYSCNDIPNNTLNSATIHIVKYDNTNFEITSTIISTLYKAFDSFSAGVMKSIGKSEFTSKIPITLDEPIYGRIKPQFVDFLTPGLLISTIFFLSIILTSMGFVTEKAKGLLQRNYVSGASSFEIMCGHILTNLGGMVINIFITLLIAIKVFNVKNEGNILIILLLCISQSLCAMTFGYLISVISNDSITAMLIAIACFNPILFTSGAIWPLEGMPDLLQSICNFLPSTKAILALQWVLLHGKGLTWPPVWIGFLSTWIWILCFIILSKIFMQIKK